ncbi:MAG: FKBP-type peptidyl-prolyl cis-trans isomerase [Bacteroidia bacterium]|nr:FKBP-type peptidyl-prolyl cis-trans isomerase [Bacteroidia bacterium]
MKTGFKLILLASLTLLITGLISCNNYGKTESGLRFKVLKHSDNQKLPVKSDIVQCFYSISTSNDSLVFSNFGKSPAILILNNPTHKGGDFMEALGMLSPGDSARFMVSADSFYTVTKKETLPAFIKPGSDIKIVIKTVAILTPLEAEAIYNQEKLKRYQNEIDNINDYLKKNSYLVMKTDTATGIMYNIIQKTDKPFIQEGDTVEFHCIGKLLDEVEFVNTYSSGKSVIIEVGKQKLPIGLNAMLMKMRAGEKGQFILPFDQGFGSNGVEGIVPPESTLIYEMNILKVK